MILLCEMTSKWSRRLFFILQRRREKKKQKMKENIISSHTGRHYHLLSYKQCKRQQTNKYSKMKINKTKLAKCQLHSNVIIRLSIMYSSALKSYRRWITEEKNCFCVTKLTIFQSRYFTCFKTPTKLWFIYRKNIFIMNPNDPCQWDTSQQYQTCK